MYHERGDLKPREWDEVRELRDAAEVTARRSASELGRPRRSSIPVPLALRDLPGEVQVEVVGFRNTGEKVTFDLAVAGGITLASATFTAPAARPTILEGAGVAQIVPDGSAVIDLLAVGIGITDGTSEFSPGPLVVVPAAAEVLGRVLTTGWGAPPSAPVSDPSSFSLEHGCVGPGALDVLPEFRFDPARPERVPDAPTALVSDLGVLAARVRTAGGASVTVSKVSRLLDAAPMWGRDDVADLAGAVVAAIAASGGGEKLAVFQRSFKAFAADYLLTEHEQQTAR